MCKAAEWPLCQFAEHFPVIIYHSRIADPEIPFGFPGLDMPGKSEILPVFEFEALANAHFVCHAIQLSYLWTGNRQGFLKQK